MSEPEATERPETAVPPPHSAAPAAGTTAATSDDEQIRKVYAKDLRAGETVHTVFKVESRERHTSRSGKVWLAMTLVDRTGSVDARVFENVDAAEGAFTTGDYLLLKGRLGTFHGRLQLVVDRLERLDPEPIDPTEFHFVAPPPPAPSRPAQAESPKRPLAEVGEPVRDDGTFSHKQTRQRVLRLLDNPSVAQALDFLLRQLDARIDERIAARLGGATIGAEPERSAPAERERHDRPERKGRGGRGADHRGASSSRAGEAGGGPAVEVKHGGHRSEGRGDAKRDPSLPVSLAFKPLDQLIPAAAAPSAPAAGAASAPTTTPTAPAESGA